MKVTGSRSAGVPARRSGPARLSPHAQPAIVQGGVVVQTVSQDPMSCILRRTETLSRQLAITGDATIATTTALGDWYVNRVSVGRRALLLATSAGTFLPIVTPAREVRTFAARLPALVGERLTRLGVPADMIAREVAAMAPMAVAKTANRQVLGVMNQYAFELPYRLAPVIGRGASEVDELRVAEDQLGDTPLFCTKPGDAVVVPDEATVVAMLTRWAGG